MATKSTQNQPIRSRGLMMAVMLGTAMSTASPWTSTPARAETIQNDLTRYCQTCWYRARIPADQWSDCTQDVFVRLLERLPVETWDQTLAAEGEERRELIRAIDTVKKRYQRARKVQALPEDVPADSADSGASMREAIETILRVSRDILSERQREILAHSLRGADVGEVADRLRIPAARVSDEKYKAMRKLRDHLRGSDLDPQAA